MKPVNTAPLIALVALALGMACWVPDASAQDHIVAIGKANPNGQLLRSATTVGGTVANAKDSTGNYTVTITATGAFAGTGVNDYIAAATCFDFQPRDRITKAHIQSVTPDILTMRVVIDDVEDSANPGAPVPHDNGFFFSVHRIPGSFAGKGSSKFLLSTGKVAANGSLASAHRLEGLAVSSTKLDTGFYELTFSKTGAFAGMDHNDFIPILSPNGTGNHDKAIRGSVNLETASEVTMWVRTDDLQDSGDTDAPLPADAPFYFTLYRIPPGGSPGPAKSQALVSLGVVAESGTLVNGGTFGGSLAAVRNATGDYTATITSPGAFAGRSGHEFTAQVQLRLLGSDDRSAAANLTVVNPNVLRLDVFISDVETSASPDEGVPADGPFQFTIHDARADHRPDLLIGAKAALSQHKGDNLYNDTGAGQTIRVKLRDRKNGRPRKKKFHFLAENDGNVVDQLRLRAGKSSKQHRMKYFQLTGGKQNVTAAMTSGALILDGLFPGDQVRFQGVAKFKKNAKKKRKKIACRTSSLHDAARTDTVKAKLVRKQ